MSIKAKKMMVTVPLAVLLLLSLGLSVFGLCRLGDFMAENNRGMISFSIKMSLFFFVVAMLSAAAIVRVQKRGFQETDKYENKNAPLFEAWVNREFDGIRQKWHGLRTVLTIFRIFVVVGMLPSLVLVLDGELAMAPLLIMGAAVFWYLGYLSDYQRRWRKPLEASLRRELPSNVDQEAFAVQMREGGKREFTYLPAPQAGLCKACILPDYFYMRYALKSCFIKKSSIRKVVLEKRYISSMWFTFYFKTLYSMEFYTAGSGKKACFTAYFKKSGDMYKALSVVREAGVPQTAVQDTLAGGHP